MSPTAVLLVTRTWSRSTSPVELGVVWVRVSVVLVLVALKVVVKVW
ncbi:hypothetical protein [Alsobacter soli]|nr:hypothetical protein [Alsobacter soli]